MSDKKNTTLTNSLKNSTSRLGLRALEPRILLDAAGFVTGADVAMDALDTQSVAEDMAAIFEAETVALAPRGESSQVELLLRDLNEVDNETKLFSEPIIDGDGKDYALIQAVTESGTAAIGLTDDGNFEIHSGETINVDLRANDTGGGNFVGIIDPANPDVIITFIENETIELASGLGVALLADGTFDVTGPINPSEPMVYFDYVVEDSSGNQHQATATFDWPIDTDGDGINDENDVDDDNDGILDTDEGFGAVVSGNTAAADFTSFRTDGIFGFATTGVTNAETGDALDGTEVTIGDGASHKDDSSDLSVGDTIVYSMNGGTTLIAITVIDIDPNTSINFVFRNEGSSPNFEFSGDGALGSAEESAELSIKFFDPNDPAFAGAADLGEVALLIQSGAGMAQTTTTSISVGDIDNDPERRLEGIGVSADTISSFTLEDSTSGGTLSPSFEGDFIRFRGTVVDPDDRLQLNFEATDEIRLELLNDANSNAGFGLGFSQASFTNAITTSPFGTDTDRDGIFDHLDIDSDNDGITDNIEAQTTADYIAPSGVGAGITDVNQDGLDDNFDSRNVVAGDSAATTTQALITPVDTDSDSTVDFLDTDSDNEGGNDTLEAGLTGAATGLSTDATDADGDGLFDVFETQGGTDATDGFNVNESLAAGALALPDADGDASAGIPLTQDVDFRDAEEDRIDTDGDGVFDSVDVDDDNDGILDVNEAGNEISGQLRWEHNDGGGTSLAGSIQGQASEFVSSVEDIVFGAGLTTTGSNYEHVVTGASAATFAEARDQNDYFEFTFTLSEGATLESLQHALVPVAWGGSRAGAYNIAVEVSDDGFATSSVIYEDSYQAIPNGQYTTVNEAVDTNLAAGTHTLRFYVYNEQNNASLANGTQLPDGSIAFDDLVLNLSQVQAADSDGDGIFDHLDIDSDNDGITDNIEAQTTAEYIAPSGVGGTADFVDLNQDGLDDNFDSRDVAEGDSAATRAEALITPVDTDSDNTADFLDTNSDNEGGNDTAEAGLTGNAVGLSTTANDADGDGLFDVFETQGGTDANDGFNVNESLSAGATALPDGDNDASNGVPLTQDVDFRDNINVAPPTAQDDVFVIDENPDANLSEIGNITNGNLLADNGGDVDSDPNSDTLTITQINGVDITNGQEIELASGALLTIRTDGTFDYNPNSAFDSLSTDETATETFAYTLSDGTTADTDTATVTITINGDNDTPIIDLNGPDIEGVDFVDVFVEDTPGQPLANLLSFDAVIQDDEDNIAQVRITPTLPDLNDGGDEFLRIDSNGIDLRIRLSDGQITATTPLTFGETTFDIAYEDGVIIITNADADTFDSDDLEGFLRLLAYENVNQNNTNGVRSFAFAVTDPSGDTLASSMITVDHVNDAPVPMVLTDGDEGFTGTVVEVGTGETPVPTLVVTPESAALTNALTEADVLERLSNGETAADLGLISVADLVAQLTISDIEQTEFGIGVISADESHGVWQYLRTDVPGHEWTDFQLGDEGNTDSTPVPDGEALLFDADTILRFVPNAGFPGGAQLDFRIWDGTEGIASNPPSTVADDSGGAAPLNTSSLSTAAFAISLAADTDGDGILNVDDVDDDNDGILDTEEGLGEDAFAPDSVTLTRSGTDSDVAGVETELLVNDVVRYGNAITINGQSIDAILTILEIGNLDTANPDPNDGIFLSANSTPTITVAENVNFDPFVRYSITLVESGTDTPVTLQNPTRLLIADVDSGNGLDVSEIFGVQTGAPQAVDLASTIASGGFVNGQTVPTGFDYYRVDPTVSGDTTDFADEINVRDDSADINVTFDNFSSSEFVLGSTGSHTGNNGTDRGFRILDFNVATGIDSDGDGIADHLDIDSDDDGITDNIEAQTTAGYIAPSGTGAGITDVNMDGLDDNYDTRSAANGQLGLSSTDSAATTAEALITPVDTDGLGDADYIDPDSDNDGISDADESGLGVTYVAGDMDGDGLADVYELAIDGNLNDGFVINEGILPLDGTLADTDNDTGSTITPLVNDLDYRDANAPPVAVDDTVSTAEDITLTTNVITTNGVDSDPDSDTLTITAAEVDLNGDGTADTLTLGVATQIFDDSLNPIGTLTLTSTGALTFVPASNYNGTVPTVNYTISDGNGHTDDANINITVTAVNDGPDAVDDAERIDADESISDNVFIANGNGPDTDPEDDTLTVTAVNGVAANVGTEITLPSGALLTLNGDGSFDYDPNGQYEGLAFGETAMDSFTYTISDGNGGTDTATVNITIDGVNDPVTPVIPGNPNSPIDPLNYIPAQTGVDSTASTPLDLTPYFTDGDTSDTVTLSINPAALPAGLTFNPATGTISGTLDADASQGGTNGVYTIPVTATDSNGSTFTTNVTYTITNPVPVAENDVATGTESSTAAAFDVFVNNGVAVDSDPDGDTLTVTRVLTGSDETALANVFDGANVGLDVAGSTGGLFTVNPDGSATFDANGEFDDLVLGETRVTEIVYQISDGEGGSDTAVVTYTVTGENDPVTAVIPGNPNPPVDPLNYIPAQTGADSAASTPLDLTPYFADADTSDTVTLSIATADLPAGLMFDSSTGIISGTPDADASQGGANGVYTIPVTATDSNGSTFTTNVTYTITNPAPVAENDSYTTDEETPISVNVLTDNDSDPDGDALVVDSAALPDGTIITLNMPTVLPEGTITILADGSVDFVPADDFNGPFVFGYTISDGEGGTDVATVTIDVEPVNDAPVPVIPGNPNPPADPLNYIPAQNAVDSDPTAPLDLTPFFMDVDADPLTLTIDPADLPAGLTFDGTTISGTPDADASQGGMNGVYVIPVLVDDGNGGTFTTNVTYTVTNPAPVVDTPVGAETAVDSETIAITPDFVDPDGDTLTYTATGLPAGLSIDPATGEITGVLDNSASQNGPASDGVYTITVTADDGEGGTVSDTFDLTVTNPGPSAQDDAVTASEDVVSTGSVFADNGDGVDSDPDGDAITVSAVGGAAANVGATIAGSNGGLFTINADGSYSFDANGEFEGLDVGETAVSTITYQISDGEGGFDDAVVTVTVNGQNDAPVVVNPFNPNDPNPSIPAQSGEDSASLLLLDVSEYFVDPDGELNLYAIENAPSWLTIDNFTGEITGTPPADASQGGSNGDGVYPITVIVTDFDGAETSIIVDYTIANPAPIAQDDALMSGEDGPLISGSLIADDNGSGADIDPDGDVLMITEINGDPALVGTPVEGSNGGFFTVNPDGTYSFDPNGDFEDLAVGETETTTLTYLVSDGEGGTDLATVTVTIEGANDAPIPVDPTQPAGPSDPSDPSDPQDPRDPPVDPQDYIPAQTGVDGLPLTPFDLTPYFGDPDGSDEVTLSIDPSDLPVGVMFDPDTGLLSGTPDADASQGGVGGVYDIPVTATDPSGETFTTIVQVTITNPAPVAQDDVETTDEDTVISDSVLTDNGNGADVDPDGDILAVTEVNGTPITSGSVITLPSGALLTVNSDGSYDYDPNGQFEDLAVGESEMDSFTYQISDGQGGFSEASVLLTIEGTNDAPIPVDPSQPAGPSDPSDPSDPQDPRDPPVDPLDYIPAQIGADGEPFTPLDLTPFFGDPDGSDQVTLSVDPADLPDGLIFDPATGVISGTPTADASQGGTDGVYTIAVTATDPSGETFTTFVEVTITNPAPIAVDDSFTTLEDTSITVNVIDGNDSDSDGDTLVVDAVALPDGTIIPVGVPTEIPQGMLTVLADGTVTLDPARDVFGPVVFGYTISDGQGGTDVATVTIDVTPVNDAPIPVDPTQPVSEPNNPNFPTDPDNPVSPPLDPENYIPVQTGEDSDPTEPLDLTPFFGDPDPMEPLVISLEPSDLPPGLTFDPATGTISGTPTADASQGGMNGVYVIPVTVTDPSGETFTTNVTYEITNPAPVADNDGILEVAEETPTVLDVLGNDVDPDGDDLTITEINGTSVIVGVPATLPSGAVVTLNSDGTISYEPASEFNGSDSFTYTIDDGQGGTDTATVNLEVTSVNDAPVVTPSIPGEAALPPQSNLDGDMPSVDVSGPFSDIDGDPLTFTATGLPEGLSIDPETGLITGTLPPGASAEGPYNVVITATDPDGETVTSEFLWTVENIAPVAVGQLPNVSFNDASDVSLPTATNFADPDEDVLTFGVTGLPVGLTIDPETGLISGTIDHSASQDGPYEITVTATDAQGESTSLTFTLEVENVAPIIDTGEGPNGGNLSPGEAGNALLELSTGLGEPTTIDIGRLASDPDGDDVLTFRAEGGLPEGLILDPATGVISGRPSAASDAPYEFTILVDDDEGGLTAVDVILAVKQDGFIMSDDVSSESILDDVDPYEFLEGQPIDLQRFFHDRALDNADELGRMFGDKDFRGGMVAVSVPGHGNDTPYMVVEAVAYDHHLTVALSSTFPMSSDSSVRIWDVTQANGSQLPTWIQWPNGTDFMQVQRPLDTETLQLRVKALLDNGRTATISVEIDLRTGTVTQLGEAYAQGQTLQEQLALETQELEIQMAEADTAQDALLRALTG